MINFMKYLKLLLLSFIVTPTAFAGAVSSFISIMPYGLGDYEGLNENGKPCTVHVAPQVGHDNAISIHIFSGLYDKVSHSIAPEDTAYEFDLKNKFFKQTYELSNESLHFSNLLQTEGLDYGAQYISLTNTIIDNGNVIKDITIKCTVI